MIGIDSVPQEEKEKDQDGLGETPEELLRRLEEEKQDWQRQLALMKATLEAQDRAIEEDRSKCREFLAEEEVKVQEAQLVPTNKAPTRKVHVVGGHPQAAKLPVVNERARTVWPSISDFHNRRARSVAKAMPMLSEAYLRHTGVAPTRNCQAPGGYPTPLSIHQSQAHTIDGLGRVVRAAKVLGYAPTASSATVPAAPMIQGLSANSSGVAISAGTPISVGTPATSMISVRRPSAGSSVPWIGTAPAQPRIQTVNAGIVPMATAPAVQQSSWFSSMFGSTQSVPVVDASPKIVYRAS